MNYNVAALQTVLAEYNQWAKEPKQLLNENQAIDLAQAIQNQGGLLPPQKKD